MHTLNDPTIGWRFRLYEVSEWMLAHDELPHRDTASIREGELAAWLHEQRAAATRDQRIRLDHTVPGWTGVGEQWADTASDLLDYVTEHRRYPSSTSREHRERRLGRWLTNVAHAMRFRNDWISRSRIAWLDEHLPDWRDRGANDQWRQTAVTYAAFVTQHGRHPSRGASNVAERSLGVWRLVQQRAAGGAPNYRWSAARQRWLDTHAPGWRSRRPIPASLDRTA